MNANKLQWLDSPIGVCERSGGYLSSVRYWVRQPNNNYVVAQKGEFRLRHKCAERNRDRRVELIYRAESCPVQLHLVAGLKAGVYQELGTTPRPFLFVPEFVPLVAPAAADDPPEEFTQLGEELKRSLSESETIPGRRRRLRERMIRVFEEVRGVKEADFWKMHRALMPRRSRIWNFPSDDHCALFRSDDELIRTSQPYICYEPYILGSYGYNSGAAELVGFAHYYGLELTVSPKWSWHYPSRTALIEWRGPYRRCVRRQ